MGLNATIMGTSVVMIAVVTGLIQNAFSKDTCWRNTTGKLSSRTPRQSWRVVVLFWVQGRAVMGGKQAPALFERLDKALSGGEGEELVKKVKVRSYGENW